MTIFRDDLIRKISKKSGFTMKDLRVVYDVTIDVITECLKEGNDIELSGFIKFFSKQVPARTVYSPITKEYIDKDAKIDIKAKFPGTYKKLINKTEE